MAAKRPDDGFDWVDWLAGLASLLGMNRVRVRWRIDQWRRNALGIRGRAGARVEQIRYEHKVCGVCGRLHDKQDKVCSGCGARLGGAGWQKVQRLGLVMPRSMTVSTALLVVILLAYVRTIVAQAGAAEDVGFSLWALAGIDTATIVRHGGLYPPAVVDGEYWRLITPVFLHFGIFHLGFNLFALTQIGPSVEELYGRTRTVLLFVVTGLVANLVSLPFVFGGVSAGASGALLGLIGVAAAWGHRDGTTQGRLVRNRMLKWAAYAVIFGFFIGANNAAHIAGFVAGGALGWFVKPGWPKDPVGQQVAMGLELGCIAVAALGLLLVMVPPKRAGQWVRSEPEAGIEQSLAAPALGDPTLGLDRGTVAYYRTVAPICADWVEGRRGSAIGRYRKALDLEPGTVDVQPLLTTLCEQTLPAQRRDCEAYWEHGLGRVVGGDAGHLSPSQRSKSEALWDDLCVAVGVPDPAAAPAADDDSAEQVTWEDLFGDDDSAARVGRASTAP